MLAGRRNWVENFFSEADDFLKNWDWNTGYDVPSVNVREDDKNYFIEVAAPGMKKEDFKVEVNKGVMMISAKTEESKEEKNEGFLRQEFSYRNFQRSFWIPDAVNTDDIKAAYDQGVLKLTVPKIMNPATLKTKVIAIS